MWEIWKRRYLPMEANRTVLKTKRSFATYFSKIIWQTIDSEINNLVKVIIFFIIVCFQIS